MTKFSIITINYNNSAGLRQTIQSVKSQSFRDYQFVVIDGGSTDGSKEIIQENADGIHHWVSEKDNGIYDAMNKGLAVANGQYVCFLNSGDYLTGEYVLASVANAIRETGALDVYYGNVLLVNETGPAGFLGFKNVDLHFMYFNMICHQGIFARRALFEQFGNFETKYQISGDYDWELRILLNKKLSAHFLKMTVCNFSLGGISSNRKDLLRNEKERIKKKYFSGVTIALMKTLRTTRLLRVMKKEWVSSIIASTSHYKWKKMGYLK